MKRESRLWRKMILKEQGLDKWVIKDCVIGGICQHKIKTIVCPPNNQALFLHEVAHALLPNQKEHNAVWADFFTELCKRYLPFPDISAWAVIDKKFPGQILFYYDNKGNPHLNIHFQKKQAIKARDEWKKAYKPRAKVISIGISFLNL